MFTLMMLGNIASGKSFACKYLEQHGARVINLDELAKSFYYPGSPVVEDLVQEFGWQILSEDGGINYSKLALIAFDTEETCRKLNAIVHPYVIDKLGELLVPPFDCSMSEDFDFTVVEVTAPSVLPAIRNLADQIMVIFAGEDTRRSRAVARGMSEDEFERRADLQPTDEELCLMADIVIDNDKDVSVDMLLSSLDVWLHQFIC